MEFLPTRFRNGVRATLIHMPYCPTLTTYIGVESGAIDETRDTNGINHFLEHLIFKGSLKWPNAEEIENILDARALDYNAFTGLEMAGFHVKSKIKHAPFFLDMFSDIVVHPRLAQERIDHERPLLLIEMRDEERDPGSRTDAAMRALIYGTEQSVGWELHGTAENTMRFTRDDLVACHREGYSADTIFVVIAGGMSIPKMEAMLESSALMDLKSVKRVPRVRPHRVSEKGISIAHVADDKEMMVSVGFDVGVRTESEGATLGILGTVLDNEGLSSRLSRRMRGELNYCYEVSGDFDISQNRGIYRATASVDPANAEKATRELVGVFLRVARERVDDDEFGKAQERISNQCVAETSSAAVEFFAGREILGW
jgi:predicted Zn-dependent peptidase